MDILAAYNNGNVSTILYSDGSKVREFDGVPRPIHPESIDVKITNWCDGGCSYCHEQSNKRGKHADLNRLFDVLSPLPKGVELALGGGDPFSHPDLLPFLRKAKERGWVLNITVNQKHLARSFPVIEQALGLVHGIGLSYDRSVGLDDLPRLLKLSQHVVFHFIAGVDTLEDVNDIRMVCAENNQTAKVLILGYKYYGLGLKHCQRNNVERNLDEWYSAIPYELNKGFSFDNLAIQQLGIKRLLSKQAWDLYYMGDDFTFTMYADAVNEMFAPTSTSNDRVSFDVGLLNFFGKKPGEL